MLGELRQRLAERELSLELTEAARAWLVRNGYDEAYGARPLRRLIQKEVENALARRVLAGEFAAGGRVTVDVVDDRLTFTTEASPAPVAVADEVVPQAA